MSARSRLATPTAAGYPACDGWYHWEAPVGVPGDYFAPKVSTTAACSGGLLTVYACEAQLWSRGADQWIFNGSGGRFVSGASIPCHSELGIGADRVFSYWEGRWYWQFTRLDGGVWTYNPYGTQLCYSGFGTPTVLCSAHQDFLGYADSTAFFSNQP